VYNVLKDAAPKGYGELTAATGTAKGMVPSPAKFYSFFGAQKLAPRAGQRQVQPWSRVCDVANLLPGDILVWCVRLLHCTVLVFAPNLNCQAS
jgi:hypothetical protein